MPTLDLAVHECHELVGRQRTAMLGQDGRQAPLAEERPLAAGLDEPVGGGEQHVAGPEGRLALGVAGSGLHAQRHARGLQRLLAVGAQERRWCVPGVGPAQRPVGDHPHEGGHEGGAGQAADQEAVGLREDLRRALVIPAARLDEEAHHRAQRGGLDALPGDVAHEHRHGFAAGRRSTRRRCRPHRRARWPAGS